MHDKIINKKKQLVVLDWSVYKFNLYRYYLAVICKRVTLVDFVHIRYLVARCMGAMVPAKLLRVKGCNGDMSVGAVQIGLVNRIGHIHLRTALLSHTDH